MSIRLLRGAGLALVDGGQANGMTHCNAAIRKAPA